MQQIVLPDWRSQNMWVWVSGLNLEGMVVGSLLDLKV